MDTDFNPEAAQLELRTRLSDYAMLDDQKRTLDQQIQTLRADISLMITHLGNQEVTGFGRIELTSPVPTVDYDYRQVDEVLARLEAQQHPLAAHLRAARKSGQRAGGLRITRVK